MKQNACFIEWVASRDVLLTLMIAHVRYFTGLNRYAIHHRGGAGFYKKRVMSEN